MQFSEIIALRSREKIAIQLYSEIEKFAER